MKDSRPIRVAHIIGKLSAGGVEAVVNNYYKNMDHKKYQFDYFIDSDGGCKPPSELIDMGVRYIVVPPYQNLFRYIKTLTKYFKENNYLIVHSGMNTLAVFSLFAAWLAQVPVRINHNHSTASKGETKKNILKYLLRPFAKLFATHYCACSHYAGEWLFGPKAVAQGKVKIFNNAINVENFVYNPVLREEVRNELRIANKFVIGHIGRFCYQKNQEFVVDIFSEFHKLNPKSVLIMIGIGETITVVREQVKALGLNDNVLFLGVRSDVNRLYQAMDAFVLPSRYEGLPVVAVEAQCAGLPVIASTEITKESKITSNISFLPLSIKPKAWASKLSEYEQFERKDETESIRKANFDIKTEAKKLEEYYDSLIVNKIRSTGK